MFSYHEILFSEKAAFYKDINSTYISIKNAVNKKDDW